MSGMLFRSIVSRSKDILLPLYKALVRPHLEYANPVWSPYLVKDIKRIESVQRQFTKKITGLRSLKYEDRLKKLKLPSLVYRRKRGDMIECYKLTHHIHDPLTTKSLFKIDTNAITRAHPYKLKKSRFNKQNTSTSLRTASSIHGMVSLLTLWVRMISIPSKTDWTKRGVIRNICISFEIEVFIYGCED